MCQPHENTSRASGGARSSTARAVRDEYLCVPSRNEHDEHAVAVRNRPLDDLAAVGRAGHELDPALELGELAHALLAAHAHDLIPPVERVPDHALAELPGRSDDADPHRLPGRAPVSGDSRASGS